VLEHQAVLVFSPLLSSRASSPRAPVADLRHRTSVLYSLRFGAAPCLARVRNLVAQSRRGTMAQTFDPFADLPQVSREAAYRHVKQMRAAGLHLIRFERKTVTGGNNLLLYFGDGKSEDLVTAIVFVPNRPR